MSTDAVMDAAVMDAQWHQPLNESSHIILGFAPQLVACSLQGKVIDPSLLLFVHDDFSRRRKRLTSNYPVPSHPDGNHVGREVNASGEAPVEVEGEV